MLLMWYFMTCIGRPGMCNMSCFGLLYTDIPTTGEYCHKKSVGVISINGNLKVTSKIVISYFRIGLLNENTHDSLQL